MAVFRKINLLFWEDTKVVDDFTPEDKYFMLYLMTNPHTNQLGCYNITIRQMEFETGYNKDTIHKLLIRLENILNVIKYSEETKEVLILNWHKYNWSSSPKILSCIKKEVETLKNKEFRYYIDTLFIQYGYSMDTQTQKEKEEEKEEEKEKEKEEEKEEKKEEEKNKEKTKKTDPFISDIKTYFLEQYIEIFGNKPILTFNECNKLNELNADIENFKDTVSGVLNKTKKIKFEFESGQNFKPDVHWILKEDNYIKVLDGTYNNQAGESEYELELRKRIEQEHQMIKEKEEQEAKKRQKRIEQDSHIETKSERLIREKKEKEEMERRKNESIERQNKVAQMFRGSK